MSTNNPFDQPQRYCIEVQGKLDERWQDYFEGMTIETTCDTAGRVHTRITGCFTDQAALHGELHKLYSLGLSLIAVQRLE